MTDVVLDASVVVKWFRTANELHSEQARALRERYSAGELTVVAPPFIVLEILNVAARRWRWDEPRLFELATSLVESGFEFRDPPVARVAAWAARGLTAYDAAYVALAEAEGIALITDDGAILELAGGVAVALAEAGGSAPGRT